MADTPEETPTNTEEYGCFTNPHTPAEPAKKGPAPTAPASDKE